ncbi:McrC family protein [Ekhidna sp.]|uniref:McrC family protein n=1 Tax=Ekhidna sp. TaxID=2608089 RepID=UPI003C7CEDC3
MASNKTIFVYEHSKIKVGESYCGREGRLHEFEERHYKLLANYLTKHPKAPYYSLYVNSIRFNQFVGVIKVGDLSIEVLPKTDKHEQLNEGDWQSVLLKMLLISIQVEAKTTTKADITIRQHSVLETYLSLFLKEAQRLIHRGLVKKYRTNIGNQSALKGKLLVHQQVTKNAVHAERFYVAHQVYNRDNVFNYIIKAALECICNIGSIGLTKEAQALLLYFPDCTPVKIDEKLFARLQYDRKTDGYRRALELARIILLNYHPDLKGGSNQILAIMFDMNLLWESFITWSLRRAVRDRGEVLAQAKKLFWHHEDNWNLRLKPDIVLKMDGETTIIDTKWKFQSGVSIEDVRQLYAYQHYFESNSGYLLYPNRLDKKSVVIEQGDFYKPQKHADQDRFTEMSCGLMFADLIDDEKQLRVDIGEEIVESLKFSCTI